MIQFFMSLVYYFPGLQVFLDAPLRWQCTFQDSATPIHEGLLNLYEDLMSMLMGILFFVFAMFAYIIYFFGDFDYPKEDPRYIEPTKPRDTIRYYVSNSNTALEFIWTLIPALLLIGLVMPTFSLLYAFDDALSTEFSLKVIGHQWYWSYEFGDFREDSKFFAMNPKTILQHRPLSFDSYMLAETSLQRGALRLLEVDNRLVLPYRTNIRALITSTDVLHSWAIPSFGVKMDACPGRLNQVSMFINRRGVFYGQCSEICGINHAFMPICIEVW